MDKLPPEIILMICSVLPKPDLSCFRLVCKNFGTLGTRPHFENLHIMVVPNSLDNLKAVANDPVLRNFVTHVFYETTVPVPLLDYDEWLQRARPQISMEVTVAWLENRPKRPPPGSSARELRHFKRDMRMWDDEYKLERWYSKAQLRQGHTAYINLGQNSARLQRSSNDKQMIFNAISKFPKLDRISISTNHEMSDLFDMSDSMKAAYQTTLTLPPLAKFDDEYAHMAVEELFCVLVGLKAGKAPLSQLTVESLSWSMFSSDRLEHLGDCYTKMLHAPPIEQHKNMFENMTILHLSMQLVYDDDEIDCQRRLGEALQNAKHLTDLTLQFGITFLTIYDKPYTLPVVLEYLVGTVIWSKLKHLCLMNIDFSEASLVDFITRHSKTLESMHLRDVWLVEGEWASTLKKLKTPLSKLTSLKLEGEFGMGSFQDETNIMLPMNPDPAVRKGKQWVADHYYNYVFKDGPFPIRTTEEVAEFRLTYGLTATPIPSWSYLFDAELAKSTRRAEDDRNRG